MHAVQAFTGISAASAVLQAALYNDNALPMQLGMLYPVGASVWFDTNTDLTCTRTINHKS